MSNYSEKLKDPRWQKKRLEILSRDDWTCQRCHDTQKTLHVHHIKYFNTKEPWEIDEDYLITLCSECHEDEREEFSQNSHDLIEILKGLGYMASDIYDLAAAFQISAFGSVANTIIVKSAINNAIAHTETLMKIIQEYRNLIHGASKNDQT